MCGPHGFLLDRWGGLVEVCANEQIDGEWVDTPVACSHNAGANLETIRRMERETGGGVAYSGWAEIDQLGGHNGDDSQPMPPEWFATTYRPPAGGVCATLTATSAD